jgi:hypothetical protein
MSLLLIGRSCVTLDGSQKTSKLQSLIWKKGLARMVGWGLETREAKGILCIDIFKKRKKILDLGVLNHLVFLEHNVRAWGK